MTEQKHTSTPWDLSCHTHDGQQLIEIGTATTTIAIITEGEESWIEDRANAAFIVRACNAHDELVEALERATNPDHELDYDDVQFILREALAKARGEA